MKHLIIILFCIFFGLFAKDPFDVNGFTARKWYGGIAGSGKGINFTTHLIIKKNPEKVHIEGILVDDRFYEKI